ncbi:Ig-like domain-containing protein [Gemmatimonas sp. UBA7669]|uniref:Ig-like domain-containing protein n=1 Tax=Gemmatimonas sp. UBA7669 TaxID=1946568 RepID=UPI0025C22712|nr:Ig-like domain-containing protein [Gemmatimonas sp. UBA7669]
MRLRAAMRLATGLVMGVVLGACEDEYGPNVSGVPGFDIRWVEVTPGVDTVFVSDTIRASDRLVLQAAAYGVGSQRLPVGRFVWGTSDSNVAVVDSFGVVTPRRFGTVEISASATRIGKATVVVAPATRRVEVASVTDTILIDEPVVAANARLQLSARAVNETGQTVTGSRVAWSVSPSSVASIDSTGLLRALTPGAAVVTAVVTSAGVQGQRTIQVLPSIRDLRIGPAPAQVLAGDTVVLTTVATNYAGQPITRAVRWQTSNPSIASVDSTGRVIFVSVGSATITASSTYRTATVSITALGRELTAVASGFDFTCGTARLGRIYCWGRGTQGQLASQADSLCFTDLIPRQELDPRACAIAPKQSSAPTLKAATIAATDSSACVISSASQLYCWGHDRFGEVGNGGAAGGALPSLATVSNERFSVLTGGGNHACAISLSGLAFCWGKDETGQLGDRRRVNSTTPIPVVGPDGLLATALRFSEIEAGDYHTCGIERTSGRAYCWGDGGFGAVGHGRADTVDVPTPVSGELAFQHISAGRHHTCGVTRIGDMYCWGANSSGQLGVSGLGQSLTPVFVGSGYTNVSVAIGYSCGLRSGGSVHCWGSNAYGQLGRGGGNPTGNSSSPAAVALNRSILSISAGSRHICAVDSEFQTWCWGGNLMGALGNGLQAAMRAVPERIAPLR